MRSRDDFTRVMRGGSKSARTTVVVYVAETGDATSMAGFAVSKAVGNAVARNRVKRRLRHAMRTILSEQPRGLAIVVRALPDAASAPFVILSQDLHTAVAAARRRVAL